jgi:ectoine hydroxylase-related dioxygenase (phytanoyl-CoA dioxygenase family)
MSEVDTAMKEMTDGDGYRLLDQLITLEEAGKVRSYVLDHLKEGESAGDGVINLTNLLNRDLMFESLVTNSRLLDVVHRLLGNDAKLAAFTAKTLMPGCGKGRLHVDYPYWAMDPGMPVTPALMMQVIWMMQPFTEDNGGTWVAPGSQQYGSTVDIDRFKREAIQATGNAGDAIISHGLLWHQTAVNASQEPRVAILINFSQLAIRPMRELGPFSEEFLASASPEMKALLPLDYGESLRNRFTSNY